MNSPVSECERADDFFLFLFCTPIFRFRLFDFLIRCVKRFECVCVWYANFARTLCVKWAVEMRSATNIHIREYSTQRCAYARQMESSTAGSESSSECWLMARSKYPAGDFDCTLRQFLYLLIYNAIEYRLIFCLYNCNTNIEMSWNSLRNTKNTCTLFEFTHTTSSRLLTMNWPEHIHVCSSVGCPIFDIRIWFVFFWHRQTSFRLFKIVVLQLFTSENERVDEQIIIVWFCFVI